MNDAEAAPPNGVALCHELIRQQAAALEPDQRRIGQLKHPAGLLLRQRFGPCSEHIAPNQAIGHGNDLFVGSDRGGHGGSVP